MGISDLPTSVLARTLEYTRFPSLEVLRCVCRCFRDVLDDGENSAWKSIIERYSTPLVPNRILWGRSLGTTALMVRASVLEHSCISCRLWFNLKPHKLYDIVLCKRCSKKHVFQVVSLKKACFNYFLDYGFQKENHNLVKAKCGRSFLVLLTHVRMVAFQKYPNGELVSKMNKRFARGFQAELKKQREKEKRIRAISHKFIDVLWQTPLRVDTVLRNQETLTDMVQGFGSIQDVFGDALERKVRASISVGTVAQRLYDYGAMLTYMRKLDLIDFKYDATEGHHCKPNHIYRHHVNGGLHFYELTKQHADARKELRVRVLEVETYILRTNMTQEERTALSVAMCAEDSINYNAVDFQEFVIGRQGNPAEISRHVREREFLLQNHLAWEINHFLVQGHSQIAAERLGKSNVLHHTKGYPPMVRGCFINLSTPPR